MLEEVAASGAVVNGCSGIHLSIFGMNPVVKFGTEEMRRKYLPAVAVGDLQEMVLNYLAEHVLGLPRSYGHRS